MENRWFVNGIHVSVCSLRDQDIRINRRRPRINRHRADLEIESITDFLGFDNERRWLDRNSFSFPLPSFVPFREIETNSEPDFLNSVLERYLYDKSSLTEEFLNSGRDKLNPTDIEVFFELEQSFRG